MLEAMGQRPTEDELFSLISEVDSDFSGTIDFSEFLRIIEKQKEKATAHNDEQDFIDAFVACGGNEDKTGVGAFLPQGSVTQVLLAFRAGVWRSVPLRFARTRIQCSCHKWGVRCVLSGGAQ